MYFWALFQELEGEIPVIKRSFQLNAETSHLIHIFFKQLFLQYVYKRFNACKVTHLKEFGI